MGVPIRGIDIKLGKNPGGNAAARMLPKGKYDLTFVVHIDVNDAQDVTHEFQTLTFQLDEKTDIVVSVVSHA